MLLMSCPPRHILRALPIMIVALAGVSAARGQENIALSGPTMGATYHIKLARLPAGLTAGALQAKVETLLANLDAQLSTYRPDSELSRFNRSPSTDWFAVSPALADVVQLSLDISARSGGAFDVTVAPLVQLWGFGRQNGLPRIPSDAEIATAKQSVGWQMLDVRRHPPALKKSRPELRVDLNGIAGFAVDRLQALFDSQGIHDDLIELGGEMFVSGHSASGQAWRVGIEQPDERQVALQMTIGFDAGGFSVSGDYRHFYERDGRRYSHIIDPARGWPIRYRGVALAVAAESCAQADAWTKPLLILGPEQGLKRADELGLAACFVLRDDDDARPGAESPQPSSAPYHFLVRASKNFQRRFLAGDAPAASPVSSPAESSLPPARNLAITNPPAGPLLAQQPPENKPLLWAAVGLCIAAYVGMRLWRRREPPPD